MPVIATAGHVDHGKSTLVRALTGRDPDRWAEEQRRGLTIDLGFAWTDLGGREVGFVDVPGHERFIKNMLAGIDGVDAALFVVAADEGWMPQSEEHLAVLDLIGVDRAVVALTRIDLVTPDDVDLATMEVAERLAGTTLAGAEIVPVAAPLGIGLEPLRQVLAGLFQPVTDRNRPRLWIDRSFTIGGAGTVVTGTLVGGTLTVGDALEVLPGAIPVRVRGLQSHERTEKSIGPGNRAAVNLSGIERSEVARGAMLGRAGEWATTTRLLADLRTVRALGEPITDRGSFHAHIGSGSHPARISLLEATTLTTTGAALISLDTPVAAAAGDHLVLREVGRRSVVAGGVVLDPHPPEHRRDAAAALASLRSATDPDSRAEALLVVREIAATSAIAADSGGGTTTGSLVAGDLRVSAAAVTRLEADAGELLRAHHRDNPLRSGMPLPALATALRVAPAVLEAIVAHSAQLIADGPMVRAAEFTPRLEGAGRAAWAAAEEALRDAGFAPPRRAELGLDAEVIHALLRAGSLLPVGPDLVYLPDTLDAIVDATARLPEGFSVGDFRDALGITRKHAVPLLEWMDASGLTRRSGDVRSFKGR